MYDEAMVTPMRQELTNLGVQELRTAEEVDKLFTPEVSQGTTLVIVNSVCGCAAGGARPGVALALKHSNKPSKITTVFAGQDTEATARARSYIKGYAPSSPSMALFKDGQVVFMLERREIEGRPPEMIASALTTAFDKYCATPAGARP